ncbi:hypothetical protein ACHWQZ_G003423 [Mnemiopsis leidyi]
MGLSYLCQILLSQERYYLIRLLSTHFTRALLLDTFTQHPFHMAVIEMRLTTLLLLLLLNTVSCTSDVTGREEIAGSTAAPRYGYNRKDPRDIIDSFHNRPIRDDEPGHTERTEVTTSYMTTEPQEPENKYTIDYQEETQFKKLRSDVTIKLLPLLEIPKGFSSERLVVTIEYSRKIRRIKKVWGGKASLSRGNTVIVITDISVANAIRSLGYTIDFSRRGSRAGSSNPKPLPVYMEVRAADDF